jgi:hypothetical protein
MFNNNIKFQLLFEVELKERKHGHDSRTRRFQTFSTKPLYPLIAHSHNNHNIYVIKFYDYNENYNETTEALPRVALC